MTQSESYIILYLKMLFLMYYIAVGWGGVLKRIVSKYVTLKTQTDNESFYIRIK